MSKPESQTKANNLAQLYRKYYITANILMMMAVAAFLVLFAFFFLDVWTNHGRTTVVPEIRKMAFNEAVATLDDCGLEYEISDSVYDVNSKPGAVKEVWPRPGSRVKPNRTVYLTINSFTPRQITITQTLTGVSSRQAITYLESLNIKNIRIVYVPSNFPDLVEGATYQGQSIVPGMKIPVNANIVLEVGTVPQITPVEDIASSDSDAQVTIEEEQIEGEDIVDEE